MIKTAIVTAAVSLVTILVWPARAHAISTEFCAHYKKITESAPAPHLDLTHFKTQLVPFFESLKTVVRHELKSLPLVTLYRVELERRLNQMTLQVLDRPRCHKAQRPFVAAVDWDKNALLICPNMSGMPKIKLLQALTHELGHVVDPCTLGFFTHNKFNAQNVLFASTHQEMRTRFAPNAKARAAWLRAFLPPFEVLSDETCPPENAKYKGSEGLHELDEEFVADYLGAQILKKWVEPPHKGLESIGHTAEEPAPAVVGSLYTPGPLTPTQPQLERRDREVSLLYLRAQDLCAEPRQTHHNVNWHLGPWLEAIEATPVLLNWLSNNPK